MDIDIIPLVDRIGEAPTALLFGAVTGIVFGVAAQRSRFCLRASAVEFARGRFGPRMAVWFLCFSTAVAWVQAAALAGMLRPSEARMMAVPGSWSGALIGGLMFGVGMILSRGCSGRLLVLAATGNLRSIVSGLIFAVVAQMSLGGWLAPARNWLAALAVTEGGHNLDLLRVTGLGHEGGLAIGLGFAALALYLVRRHALPAQILFFGSGVGFAVALGYVLTFTLASISFEPTTVESMTFTGPSAQTLMFFLSDGTTVDFSIGMVPGVFVGSFIAAAFARELAFQGFDGVVSMQRAMIGAALMGFGGMLAGGCSIGNGVSGTSIFAGTAWLALSCMWIGAVATDDLLDRSDLRASA